MRFHFFFASVFVSVGMSACATSEEVIVKKSDASATEPAAFDATSFCASYCDRILSCDRTTDSQTCTNQCKNQNAAIFPRLRSDVVQLIVDCYGAKDCKTVLGGSVIGTCAKEAIASVAPSTEASTFCEGYSKTKQKCSGSPSSKADCLNVAKLYTDEAIGQAENCTTRSCAELDPCVGAIFGTFSTSTGTETGTTTPTCTGKFADLGTCSSCAEQSCCGEASACAGDAMCRSLINVCSSATPSTSLCSSYYSSATSTSKSLAQAYFDCADTKCTSSCRAFSNF